MKALKKIVEVRSDKSITLDALPFKAGSRVEIIILPADEKNDIFSFMDAVVKRKKISPMSLGEIEAIVHKARAVK